MPDASLFEPDTPEGFVYQADFIAPEEEDALLCRLGTVPFAVFEMRGVVARRRVAFFGHSYTAGQEVAPVPDFLLPLRAQVAAWATVEPEAFAMALVNEYRPGAPIGWHRDAPQYDLVAGVSLLAPCRMRFRPYAARGPEGPRGRRTTTHEVVLEPRSAYLISGAARQHYEHHIPAVAALRYSVTFRTLRRPARG
jgi:alkylated DNA repair dioxygenase AlkB